MGGTALKLIVGLGNPGRAYARTRHNVGWWFLDALAARGSASPGTPPAWRRESKLNVELGRARLAGHEVWLAKPGSFMNNSGTPVAAVAGFYRIEPGEILVVHDEIDLPPGVARLKRGGGHGGHNGLRDVIAHLGADFWRLRLGVGHPGARDLVIDAVLSRPSGAEEQAIEGAIARALDATERMLRDGAELAMQDLHRANPRAAASEE